MKSILRLVISVALLIAPVLGLLTQSAEASGNFPPLTAQQSKVFRDDQLFRVNRLRANLTKKYHAQHRPGLHQLKRSKCLERAATKWSQHMADNGGLSHSVLIPYIQHYCGTKGAGEWGENVAYRGPCGAPFKSCSREIFRQFVHSEGHYDNMKDPHWAFMGAGAYRDSNGTLYLTQEFVGCKRDCGNYAK
jgi:uncharacterized protein YkwD